MAGRRGVHAPGLAVALCCMFLANAVAFAQGTRGTINGTVTDPSGAAIIGATVQVERIDTGQTLRTVQTNDEGVFQALEIDPGAYNVIITASGFAEARLLDVKVEPNRNVRLDAALNVTGASETVEVTAGTELIEKDSATLGTTVDRQRVQGLPLNGRNVLQLATLQPGVIPSGDGFTGQGTGFSVNGSRPVENNITLDGSNNNEVAGGATVGAQPRPDAVQEFRLLTSNYEAEFGRNTGSVVNVVTRSGSSEFHGNARIFYRPTFLSAARFFDKANATPDQIAENDGDLRRSFERKEFGGNLGGPVIFPKLYNGRERTFFFVDYEGRRQKIGNTATLTGLPTAAERVGDFSQLGRVIRDPATGQPFPGNIIPMDRFSPIARYYLQFLPTGDNGVAVVRGDDITDFDQITSRFDHYISENQTINYTLSYFDQEAFDAFAFGGSSVPGFGAADIATTQNHVVRHTYTFTPTLINSFMFAYARNNFPGVVPASQVSPRDIGFTGNFLVEESLAGAPQIQLFDRNLVIGSSIQGPQTRVPENFQIQNAVSWAKGEHRFKFGFDGTQYRQDQEFLFINNGVFLFSGFFGGNTTGDDLADFLIGNSPIAFQSGNNGERDFRQKYVAAFAQDSWRVRDDLTLSLGLRYEYTSPITDLRNRVAFYRPGVTSQLLESGQLIDPQTGVVISIPEGGRAPNGLVFVGDPDPVLGGTVPEGGVAKDFNNFAPRFGIAYAPLADDGIMRTLLGDRQTAIRAGFGVYYGYIIGDAALQQLGAPGFDATGVFFFPGSGTLADPFAPDPFPNYRGDQGTLPNPFLNPSSLVAAPLSSTSQSLDPNIRTPYNYQWNLTVERGFLTNYVATVSYVGTRGLKLYVAEQVNPSLGTFFPAPADYPVATPSNPNSRRLNRDILSGVTQLSSAGTSDYHALEAQLQRRFADGLTFQLAYTFSKAISDADTQRGNVDILDRRAGRSLSSFDAPHRLVGNFIWELPFFRGTDGFVNRVAHGWSVGAIATFQSGTPFTVQNLFDTVGTGGGVFSFADLGAPYVQLDPRENDGRAFNVDAFVPFGDPAEGFNLATDFRRGTSGPNQFRLNNGINNWDVVVTKKTALWSETSNLELRFEAFNAFNRAQFTTVDLNLNNIVRDPVTGQIDPARSAFGKYTGTREARVIQLAARINF